MLAIMIAQSGGTISAPFLVLILIVAAGLSLGLRSLSSLPGERFRVRRWVPTLHVAIWALAVAVLVMAVASKGFTTTLLLVLLALSGVVVAGMGWLRNVVAGLILFSEDRLAPGDRIEVGDHRGEVIHMGVRSIQLRDLEAVVHDIPYVDLVSGPISRFSDAVDALCEFEMELNTDDDPQKVLQTVQRIAGLAPLASPRRKPRAFLKEPPVPGEALKVEVRSHPFSADQRDAYRSDVMRRLKQRFG